MSLPVIGVTLDLEPAGGYAVKPWYALRQNYCDSLVTAGGTAIALPYQTDVAALLDVIDGLCISGGGFDIPPTFFGQAQQHPLTQLKLARTQFEWALLQGALQRNMPVLGICGGQQLIAAWLGASLVQHIPDTFPDAVDHSPSGNAERAVGDMDAHEVRIVAGTRLHQSCQSDRFQVNSSHHQAVASPLPEQARCIINAYAPDGVVEGIESIDHQFCVGVQWHPEYQRSAADRGLLESFVMECQQYQASNRLKQGGTRGY